MQNEDITPDSLPESGGEGTVGVNPGEDSPVSPTGEITESMTLEELNRKLGKKAEPDVELLRAKGLMTKQEFETELFLRDNPQHAQNKKILESIASADKISLPEAAKSPEYMKLFESASEYEKAQSLKTVLNPNPRLQQAQERTSTIIELQNAGRGSDAQNEAARILIETFDLK